MAHVAPYVTTPKFTADTRDFAPVSLCVAARAAGFAMVAGDAENPSPPQHLTSGLAERIESYLAWIALRT